MVISSFVLSIANTYRSTMVYNFLVKTFLVPSVFANMFNFIVS